MMPIVFMGDGFMLLVTILSILSGFGSYLQGCREGRLSKTAFDLLTEITFALIVGLATGYVSEAHQVRRGVTCAIVLILSNNATDTLGQFKKAIINRLANFPNSGDRDR